MDTILMSSRVDHAEDETVRGVLYVTVRGSVSECPGFLDAELLSADTYEEGEVYYRVRATDLDDECDFTCDRCRGFSFKVESNDEGLLICPDCTPEAQRDYARLEAGVRRYEETGRFW